MTPSPESDEAIAQTLGTAVAAYRDLPPSITVSAAILSLTGCKVIPIDPTDPADQTLVAALARAAATCIAALASDPIRSKRVNEVGNLFEPRIKTACEQVGLRTEWPTSETGRGSRSGYPDLLIHDVQQRPTYLEVKTVGPGQDATSLRSFYLSPSEQPKVRMDARHLLIAFDHRAGDTVAGLTAYTAHAYKIVDLSHVRGNVKFEYQSSNNRLYRAPHLIA